MIKFFRKIRKNLLNEGKTSKYFKYAIGEIVLVVIGILIALSINNWNENRKTTIIENKILTEIANGLQKDLIDVNLNRNGHNNGIKAVHYWNKIINNKKVNPDSIQIQYHRLLRDFISIQNTSGYESLKSRGLELVKNDSLRLEIISLYEEDYSMAKKIEEEYVESQYHKNYFKEINALVSPNFIFDSKGDIESIELPLTLSKEEKNKLQSYLMKIRTGREFTLLMHDDIDLKIKKLLKLIESEI